jgi:hypothetical protein
MRNFPRASVVLERYFRKAHQDIDKNPVNIARAINANEMTSRLNLRIRVSYASAQLISPSLIGLRLAEPINAILICEKVAPLNQLLPYYFPRFGLAFGYGEIGQTKHAASANSETFRPYRRT